MGNEQMKVDTVSKIIAAMLTGATNWKYIIEALGAIKDLNPNLKSWMTHEHAQLDTRMIRTEDVEKFKELAVREGLEYYQIYESGKEDQFAIVITKGPKYQVDEYGRIKFDINKFGEQVKIPVLNPDGSPILGDRQKLDNILTEIRHEQQMEYEGVTAIEDIDNILTPEAAEAAFHDNYTVLIDNMSYADALLMQKRADEIGLDTFLRYNPETGYKIEVDSYKFQRMSNLPDKMCIGERMVQDYLVASCMPEVEKFNRELEAKRDRIQDFIKDAKDSLLEESETLGIVNITKSKQGIIISNGQAKLMNFNIEGKAKDIVLDITNDEGLNALHTALCELGDYDKLALLDRDKNIEIGIEKKDIHDLIKSDITKHQNYEKACKLAYEVNQELIANHQIELELRNYSKQEKEKLGITADKDGHLQMVNQRIPNSDIIIEDALEFKTKDRPEYGDVRVLNFSEKFKTKMAEINVCEAMRHIPVQAYANRDHAEFLMDIKNLNSKMLEGDKKFTVLEGVIEPNPEYKDPEQEYAAEFNQDPDFIDRDHDGIDDRIEGMLDYDGDALDDREEGEIKNGDFLSNIVENHEIDGEYDQEYNEDHDLDIGESFGVWD